ncbi:MAG: shikimate dehydrogenase [Bryobacterales bacterium]|nr:shikimate dehydrogenase [Bryobacterales bacterium]
MPANYQAELVGVFGQPVAENPTGVMQEAGFAAAGLNWRYLNFEVSAEKLGAAMQAMEALGVRGINLTIPHKVAVIEHLDDLSPEARAIGAVNTVRLDNGRKIGENTDGKGFLRGVRADAGMDPDGKRVVLLGAGGAARAIGTELVLAGASDLLVVNRSAKRGETMVSDLLAATGGRVRFKQWEGTYPVPETCDLFVNATSIGLYPDVDAMPAVDLSGAPDGMLVADVVFNPPETRLLAAARKRGLPTLDGLSMLVYQGVIAFEMWTGQSPDEAAMKSALRAALAEG